MARFNYTICFSKAYADTDIKKSELYELLYFAFVVDKNYKLKTANIYLKKGSR